VAIEVQMPKLGLTMQAGTIADWLVPDGTVVTPGTAVLLIATDKVETEWQVDEAGIIRHGGNVGDTYECGATVGWLLADGEEPPAIRSTPSPAAAQAPGSPATAARPAHRASTSTESFGGVASRGEHGRLLASPNARRVAAELGIPLEEIAGTGPAGRITSEDVESAVERGVGVSIGDGAAAAGSDRFVPLAARTAAERLGVDLATVRGSGPDGRVTRHDVYSAARSAGPDAGHGRAPALSLGEPVAGPRPGDSVPLTGVRGVIAERMHESLRSSAQLTLSIDVDMGRAVALRDQLEEIGPDELGTVPGFTDFVIAAAARALRRHPMANASIVGDSIEVLRDVNVGMAVAVDAGLIVPVVRAADELSLLDLAVESQRLATAARDGKLGLADLEGGTFSVSALGMFGVDFFTPVINPPNAAILGVGRIRDDVAWDGDIPVKATSMTLSLTWDHRILDGAPAADFAGTIRRYLEEPVRLLA